MALKRLNKILVLIVINININVFSQMTMFNIDEKQFSIDLKEKTNIIKILDDSNYSIYYILDRRSFGFDKKHKNIDLVNLIFLSKKYNKGILTIFRQSIEHKKKSVYNITLYTDYHDKNMFVSSMAILDKDFNYEYFMKYSYLPPPPPSNGIYTSWITIQDIKNHCNKIKVDLKGNVIYENIDDILSNIYKITQNNIDKDCSSIIYDIDREEYFPKKIGK